MNAKVIDVEYKASDSWIQQGYSRGRYPTGKAYGGNGTYRVFAAAEIDVMVEADNGRRYTISIGRDVRDILGRARLTRRMYDSLVARAPDAVGVENDGERWKIDESDLKDWVNSIR